MILNFKKLFLSVAASSCLLISTTNVALANLKLKRGIFNMQQIIEQSKRGQDLRNTMQTEVTKKQQYLLSQKEKIEKLDKELKEKQVLLSQEAKLRKQQELQEKFLALRKEEMNFHSELQQKQAQATHMMTIEVKGIVDKLAKSKNLFDVHERSQIFYIKDEIDLTNEIITAYNKKEESNNKISKNKTKKTQKGG